MLPIRETIATEQIYDVRKAQRFYWSRYFGVYAGLNLCGCEEERGGDEDHLQPSMHRMLRTRKEDKTGQNRGALPRMHRMLQESQTMENKTN